MTGTIKFKIDGEWVEASPGMTILEAALANGIYIPHLCFSDVTEPFGGCRLCLVESEGRLVTACENPAEEGMNIVSESGRINRIRRNTVSLIITNHSRDCLTCRKSGDCKLQEVASYLDVSEDDLERLRMDLKDVPPDDSNPFS